MTSRRAIVATEHWFGATGRSLAQAFREIGWLVHEVDSRSYGFSGRSIAARFAARALSPLARAEYARAILNAAKDLDVNVVLTMKGHDIPAHVLATLRQNGITTVNFYPDYEFARTGMPVERLDEYDLVATTKSFHIPFLQERLTKAQVALVQHGFDPAIHRPVRGDSDGSMYARDICYVGNASSYKRDWLVALAATMPEQSMAVFGLGWAEAAAGTPLARAVADHQVSGDFYAREVGRSRVNIALHMGPSTEYGWQDFVSTRTFEIPACSGFMLHIDNPEVRTLFEAGQEMDTFASPDELSDKVRYYLGHIAEREAIAARGHFRALSDHTLASRAKTIATLVAALP